MKILNILIILIAIDSQVSRILQPSKRHASNSKTRHSRKTHKMMRVTELNNLTIKLNNDIELITHAYEELDDDPHKNKKRSKLNRNGDTSSDEFNRSVTTIESSLKDSNKILTTYIYHYVLTPKIVQGFYRYMKKHKIQKTVDRNDILVYMAKHVKTLKMHKKEDTFFSAANKFKDLLNHQLKELYKNKNKHLILKKIKVKLMNANKLITFIRKYMFFITHLNTDYHFVDSEFAKFGENGPEVSDVHKIKHKGFTRDNDHVPYTIVISKDDIQKFQQGSSNNTITSETETPHGDDKESYISKQLQQSQVLNDIKINGPGSIITSQRDENREDDEEIKLLTREKEENGFVSDPNHKIGFVEPVAKSIDTLTHDDFGTLDLDQAKKVNEILNLEPEERLSELNNLSNLHVESDPSKLHVDLTHDVYKPSLSSINFSTGNQAVAPKEGSYVNQLLDLHSEHEELHVSAKANNSEPSNLELIRQPTLESSHDHGYLTVITPDDERNIRISKKAEFDTTSLGKETKEVIDTYNNMTNYNSNALNNYFQTQDPKIQNYFQPVINDTFHSLNQPIIQPNDTSNTPYYVNDRPSYGIDPKIGQSLNIQPSVRLLNQGPSMASQNQARRLIGISNDYWDRKAENAFRKLLSGKFRL